MLQISRNAQPFRLARLILAATAVLAPVSLASAQVAGAYTVTSILSDGSVTAAQTDPNFINPWAISVSNTAWISANGSGFNYVIPTSGVSSGMPIFKVIVPAPNGTSNGTPTGSVTTNGSSSTSFVLPNGTKANFLFATDTGTVSGWNSKLGTANAVSQIVINNSAANASYTGLTVLNTANGSFLLAPNFGAGAKVEVYDSTFKPATLAGSFTDPNLPTGYAPYSIHILNSQIFVTFAVHVQIPGAYGSAGGYNEVVAPGNGIVDIFDLTGTLVTRALTGGNLNEPWGVAFAPSTFGIYANDLLVGNFGDGIINVYDPKTYAYLGQMMDGTGKTLVYPSLWELLPAGTPVYGGTAVSGGTAGSVYFTAGLANQAHGLYAAITNDAVTMGTPAFGASVSNAVLTVAAGSSATTSVSLAPTYNFVGSVTLACAGLPVAVTCNFASPTVAVNGNTPVTVALTIATTKASAQLQPMGPASGIAFAFILPMLGLGLFSRRKAVRLTLVAVCGIALASMAAGCSSASTPKPFTPAGSQIINVTATAGANVKTIPINLIVQ